MAFGYPSFLSYLSQQSECWLGGGVIIHIWLIMMDMGKEKGFWFTLNECALMWWNQIQFSRAGCYRASCQHWSGCSKLCSKGVWEGKAVEVFPWFLVVSYRITFLQLLSSMQVSLASDFTYNYLSKEAITSFGYDYILRQVTSAMAYCYRPCHIVTYVVVYM